MKSHFKVLILGAGSGGLSVAARLSKKISPTDIAIVDPALHHYYQPLWTLSGAGIISKEKSQKPMASLIPKGVIWFHTSVSQIDPDTKTISLTDHPPLKFDYLLVALGLTLAWKKIPGALESLGRNGVCTVYEYDQVDKTSQMLENFKGGTAIFTMPPVPIKCAGAPQKIMYLADEIFRKNGIREKSKVYFATAGKAIFGIPVFAEALNQVARRKGIELLLQHQLISVDSKNKTARFLTTDSQGKQSEKDLLFDLIHVVPPMVAPEIISNSVLAAGGDQKGWLEVDKNTLQHKKYPFIYGIGDVTGVPNSKTGAAIRKQAPVVVANLLSTMNGKAPTSQYDGYSSCPLVTGVGKVILAEFGYDGKLMPSFPFNPAKERWTMWLLKRYLLPILYWKGMLKGRA